MRSHPGLNRRILGLELLILLAAVLYYELGTFWFRAEKAVADAHAIALWDLEKLLGLFVEPWFQAAFESVPPLMALMVFFYVGPHFLLTFGFFVWAYWYRFPSYPEVRDSFLAFTMLSFGFQWLVPLSPPRYIPAAGLRDTLEQTLPVSGETPWIQQFTNPYAALPSVHFGWALLVAILFIRLGSHRYRHWALAYPTLIGLSILATGNHWILDMVFSIGFLALTELVLSLRRRLWTTRPHSAPTPPTAPTPEPG